MNEIENRELKGLGGWLVLFQIQIWSNLVGAVQAALGFLVIGIVSKSGLLDEAGSIYPLGFFEKMISPYMFLFLAVMFVLVLMCVIFFYKKRMVFRTIYVAYAVVSIIGLALYYIFIMSDMLRFMMADTPQMGSFMLVYIIAVGFVPALGLMTALIIALFKSKRVKNTFS